MEAILLNPSILLVDLIVAGVCVGVVFFTKFNIIGATLKTVEKGSYSVVTSVADGFAQILGITEDGKPVHVQDVFPTWKSWADYAPTAFSDLFK